MNNTALQLFSARDAKTRFGEVLDTALGQPVGITKHDRLTAYIVSKNVFEAMLNKIQQLEDQLWLQKADAARNEGFASAGDVEAFLHTLRNTNNDSKHDETGSEVLGGPR